MNLETLKSRYKPLLLLFLTLLSPEVNAQLCTTWGCYATIEELYTNANGNVYIGTHADETLANCTAPSGVFFTLDTTSGNADYIYSALLAAYMSESKIKLRIAENSNDCTIDYATLVRP